MITIQHNEESPTHPMYRLRVALATMLQIGPMGLAVNRDETILSMVDELTTLAEAVRRDQADQQRIWTDVIANAARRHES